MATPLVRGVDPDPTRGPKNFHLFISQISIILLLSIVVRYDHDSGICRGGHHFFVYPKGGHHFFSFDKGGSCVL